MPGQRVPSFRYVTEWLLAQDAILQQARAIADAEFRFRLDVLRGVGYRVLTSPTMTVLHGVPARLRAECLVSGPHATALAEARRPLFLGSI